MRQSMASATPGLEALTAGLEASGRWLLANRATAQLMFWRPVPRFEPSAEAFAPSVQMVLLQRTAMADTIARPARTRGRLRRSRRSRLDIHRRSAEPGHGQRARPRLGPGSLYSHLPETYEAARRRLPGSHYCIEAADWHSLTPNGPRRNALFGRPISERDTGARPSPSSMGRRCRDRPQWAASRRPGVAHQVLSTRRASPHVAPVGGLERAERLLR